MSRTRAGAQLAAKEPVDTAAPQGEPAGDVDPDVGPPDVDDAESVLELWRTVVLAMIGFGLVAAGRNDPYDLRWWEDTLDESVVDLLSAMLLADRPLSVDRLVDDAMEQLAEDYELDRMSESARDGLPGSVAWGMSELTDRLVWLGLATRDDVRVEVSPFDRERRLGGRVALTPLGVWFVRPLLIAQGVDVPVVGALVDADADGLLDAVADWPQDAFEAEVARWAADRPTAADELAAAVRVAAHTERVGLVFEALDVVGVEAEPAVRALADDPRYRPFVSAWLRDQALEPLRDEPGEPGFELVRSLAVVLVSSGPDAAAEAAVADRVDGAVVERLWRIEDPWTTPVLEALAAGPHKRLSKAARRALFKRRNRN